ncbi:EpsG family protein [Vibrio hepatarius]|uniref:EpsG family protein n=1 Tax=Vibrio hepatarius TaxID=171383 RepID=A0A0M0HXU9_9VIBR|nr:EpsG family protein [Vibrio hepatarius]KOO06687.1 hypothetical protein AKJ31_15545 [Vibrio hepatarius]
MTLLTFNSLILSFIFVLLCSFFVLFKFEVFNKIYIFIATAFCYSIAIRDRGWDVQLYKNIYSSVNGLSFLSEELTWLEPSFIFIIATLRTINAPFFVFSLAWAIITFWFLSKVICKLDRYVLIIISLFFFLYFYRGPYGQVRQGLSLVMFLYSISFLSNKEYLKYTFINSLALTVHSTAIMSFPFLFFYLIFEKSNRQFLNIFVACAVIISFIDISSLFSTLLNYIDLGRVGYKFNYYLSSSRLKGLSVNIETVRMLFVISVVSFIYPRMDELDKYLRNLILAYYFGVILYFILSFDLRIASRSARAFLMTEIIILPFALDFIYNRTNKFFYRLTLLIICLGYLALELYMMGSGEIIYG